MDETSTIARRLGYHWATNSILDQSPRVVLHSSLDDLVAPHLAAAPVHISPPRGRGDVNYALGPRRPLSPSAGAVARACSRNAGSTGDSSAARHAIASLHDGRVARQRPVGHAVAHQRAHRLRHERDARRPRPRARSRSASRPPPARSAPRRRAARSSPPAPPAGPGEPAGVSSTSGSPSRSASRSSGRWASGCTSGSATTTGSSSTVSNASPGARAAQAHEADVEPPVLELAQLLGRAELVQAQRDVRLVLAERAQQLGHERVHRRADEADRQPPDLAALDAPRLARRVLDRVEDLARAHEERRPGRGQLDLALVAQQQRRADLLLELADLLARAAAGTCAGAPRRGGSAAPRRRRRSSAGGGAPCGRHDGRRDGRVPRTRRDDPARPAAQGGRAGRHRRRGQARAGRGRGDASTARSRPAAGASCTRATWSRSATRPCA